jgi:hypothetical protein
MARSYVIVDIDGTIADVRHRLHHIHGPGRKNWKAFFEAMDGDLPISNMLHYVRQLAEDHNILIITGRPDNYRERTERWLRKNQVPFDKLYMRPAGDHRPDYEAKAAVLEDISPKRIVMAIDDRPPVCDMWEAHGIRCLRVESDADNQLVNEIYRQKPSGAHRSRNNRSILPKRTRRTHGQC